MTAPEQVRTAACCPDEQWAAVPSWPYEASTCGRVRGITRLDHAGRWRLGAPAAPYADRRPGKGYLYVTLTDGKRRRNAAISVLVLEAHRGLRPGPGYEACHNTGVRTDNHLSRLRWDTKAANRADREEHRWLRAVTEAVTANRAYRDETGRDPSRARGHGAGRLTRPRRYSPFHRDVSPGTGRTRPSILARLIIHIRSSRPGRKAS